MAKWLDKYAMGGALPGATGMMYARTQDPAPSNGKYAKKTKASAQNGKKVAKKELTEEQYYNPPTPINKSGNTAMDMVSSNPWLMNVPILGNYIKDEAYRNAAMSGGFSTFTPVDDKTAKELTGKGYNAVGKYTGGGGDEQYDLLKQYIYDDQNLQSSPYSPKDDYLKFLPSYSLKDKAGIKPQPYWKELILNNKSSGYSKDLENVVKTHKPKFYSQESDAMYALSRMYNTPPDLAHYKAGIGYDEDVNLPYVSVSDAWDFYPKDYQEMWGKSERDRSGDAYQQSYLMHKAGKPFKIYDRFYVDPKTKEPISDKEIIPKKLEKKFTPKGLSERVTQELHKGIDKSYNPYMQNGGEMAFYQNGLDFKPKSISKNGSIIKDDRGQWAYPGEVTEIGSNDITMQGVDYPVLGVSDTGDTQMMYPDQDYKFDGEKVTEFPMAQDGKKLKNVKGESEKFLKEWMDSPMYNKMINTSINASPNQQEEILKAISREDQLKKMSWGFTDLDANKSWLAKQYSTIRGQFVKDKNKVLLNPNSSDDTLSEVGVHEGSHATDLGGVNIPRSDIEKMSKYKKEYEKQKSSFTKLLDREDFNTYVGRPTETRARLNAVRYLGKKEGIYNPYKEKVDKDILKKLPSSIFFPTQLDQLKLIYSDDQIIDLLNSVSKNDSNKLIPQAQNGDWLSKYATEPMRQDATRVAPPVLKLTDKEKLENAAKSDQAQKRALNTAKEVITERQKNKATKGDLNTPGSWHTEDKARLFPNSPGGLGEVIDEYINPATYVGVLADALGESVAARDPKGIALSLALSAGAGAMGLDPLGSAIKGVKAIPKVTRAGLNAIDRNFSDVGQSLAYIEKEGLKKGLSSQRIKKKQIQYVGITSNQREAYVPGVSDALEKYVFPQGYTGPRPDESKLAQTINNIINRKRENSGPSREDAWSLYLGKPQKYNTFRMAETAPINHPAYTPKQLSKMDIYSINATGIYDDGRYSNLEGIGPRVISDKTIGHAEDIASILEKNSEMLTNPISHDHHFPVMGGYNKRLNQYGLEYNDIWDLEPKLFGKKIKIDKFIGKPFMSHEVLPDLTSENVKSLVTSQIKNADAEFKTNIKYYKNLDKGLVSYSREIAEYENALNRVNKLKQPLGMNQDVIANPKNWGTKDWNNTINNPNFKKENGGWLNKYK